MSHGSEFIAIVVVCAILPLGAVTRHIARRTGFPYTVALILLGLGAGFLLDQLSWSGATQTLTLLGQGKLISPDLIIFVFLPALVFESAFNLDQHAFAKELGAFALLAVPALLVSTALVGGGMVLLTAGSWGWSWTAALVFGALISATDPVAVVAILREVGAPKRLGILVEGESLLNDGTAIVVFSVLVSLLATDGAQFQLGDTLVNFARVVIGGALVGFVLAYAVSRWVGRLFNDPLVETTLTIVVAYLAMVVGEGYLHVSGVIAVVVCGLWIGGKARTSISPEVLGFLHHYWDVLTFLANTLIFFLAGLLISRHIGGATVADLGIVLAAYVIVMAVRFGINFAFRPLLGLTGSSISSREAIVLSWSGLRGAVSLALALVVLQNEAIDATLRRQIILATAGVVLLTVLINGSTVGRVLAALGFNKRSADERLAKLAADDKALSTVRARVAELAQQADFSALPWPDVEQGLATRGADVRAAISAAKVDLGAETHVERLPHMWKRALDMEREAYWAAFAEGTLGARALHILALDVDTQLDRIAVGDLSAMAECACARIELVDRRAIVSRLRKYITRMQFRYLALTYDMARSAALAAEQVTDKMAVFADDAVTREVQDAYRALARAAHQRVEELRVNLPELTSGVEARLAQRIALNVERDVYRQLLKSAVLNESDAKAALADVELRMKTLLFSVTKAQVPETIEVCRNLPMFASLDAEQLSAMAAATKERILGPGELLFKENAKGSSVFVIVRGAAHVFRANADQEQILDIAHTGDVLGEMAFFSGERRSASVRAITTLTVGELDQKALADVMKNYPTIRDEIWDAYVRHVLDNHLRADPRFRSLSATDRQRWIAERRVVDLNAGEALADATGFVLVLSGLVLSDGNPVNATAIINVADHTDGIRTGEASRLALLPAPPASSI